MCMVAELAPHTLLTVIVEKTSPGYNESPEIRPVEGSIVSPGGRFSALKVTGQLGSLALTVKENVAPSRPKAVNPLVTTGMEEVNVSTTVLVSNEHKLLAVITGPKTPFSNGMPEIKPFVGFSDKPAGSNIASNRTGECSPVIW